MENMDNQEENDVLVFDTGSRQNGTITERAWHVFKYTNHQQDLHGYQDNSKVKLYHIVNAVIKAWIKDNNIPVFLVMKYATLIDDMEKK